MNIQTFLKDESSYKKNVLVYPNITYQEDLEKDSYIVVISNVIEVLNKHYDGVHYDLLVPYRTESLNFENVSQLKIELPTYPNAMRTHFDTSKVQSVVSERSYDFIYSHLPEHTLQLRELFPRKKIVGYCHWYEIDENTHYPRRLFLNNLFGTLEMDECGVNSEWLKSLVLQKSSEYLSENIVRELNQIIQSHPLGIDSIDISDSSNPKTVVFNHRSNEYTGWNWFVKEMDNLWEKRKDFVVYTTLVEIDRPWSENVSLDSREDYLNFLKEVSFGVGCFEDYSAWSISTTDGLSRGTPYLVPDSLCYPEMLGGEYPLFYNGRSDFIKKFERLLDSDKYLKQGEEYIENVINEFRWENRVLNWMNWDELLT